MTLAPFYGRCIHCGHNHGEFVFSLEKYVPNTTSGSSTPNKTEVEHLKSQLAADAALIEQLHKVLATCSVRTISDMIGYTEALAAVEEWRRT